MRKVTLVSLGGNAYQLEDGAHEAISRYLERAAQALAANPDRNEILADLEQAIADKCDSFLGKHKNVIAADEAAQIIREMGPVQGQTSGAEAGAARETSAGSATADATRAAADAGDGWQADTGVSPPPRRRRLMRIPGEGMLGGVCAGLSAYFDVDVVWVRLAVVLLAFVTGGIAILGWITLLIVMPAARTPEQVASARGDALSAREVMEMARRKSADIGKAAAEGLRDAGQNLRETFGPRG